MGPSSSVDSEERSRAPAGTKLLPQKKWESKGVNEAPQLGEDGEAASGKMELQAERPRGEGGPGSPGREPRLVEPQGAGWPCGGHSH